MKIFPLLLFRGLKSEPYELVFAMLTYSGEGRLWLGVMISIASKQSGSGSDCLQVFSSYPAGKTFA